MRSPRRRRVPVRTYRYLCCTGTGKDNGTGTRYKVPVFVVVVCLSDFGQAHGKRERTANNPNAVKVPGRTPVCTGTAMHVLVLFVQTGSSAPSSSSSSSNGLSIGEEVTYRYQVHYST